MKGLAVFAVSVMVTAFCAGVAGAVPRPWQKCSQVNARYPHGIGRAGARDHVAAGAAPVTNFTRSTRLYLQAMSHNGGLDRDHDGVACETP